MSIPKGGKAIGHLCITLDSRGIMQYRNNSRCYVCVHLVSASLFASVEIVAPIGLGAAWSFVLETGFFCLLMAWFSGFHGLASLIAIVGMPPGSVNAKC